MAQNSFPLLRKKKKGGGEGVEEKEGIYFLHVLDCPQRYIITILSRLYNLSRLNSPLFNEVSVKVAFLVSRYFRGSLRIKSVGTDFFLLICIVSTVCVRVCLISTSDAAYQLKAAVTSQLGWLIKGILPVSIHPLSPKRDKTRQCVQWE